MKSLTTAQHWPASDYSAYIDLGTTFEAWTGAGGVLTYASVSSQVFSASFNGNNWNWTGAGGMLSGGDGSASIFGGDGFWNYKTNSMCPISGGVWSSGVGSGVWALGCDANAAGSSYDAGGRAACFLGA
jgi:hypothetical protein